MENIIDSKMSILCGKKIPELIQKENLGKLFHESAIRNATRIAAVFEDRAYTYSEIDRWSDAMAIEIRKLGLGSGDLIGVWWPRGIELHIAILGIAKSGAAYVPVDVEMPEDRLLTVLKESGAKACFSKIHPEINILHCEVIPMPSEEIEFDIAYPADANDVAYVLYTSGSTGKPKGIPITQKQICHLIRAEQEVIQIVPDDKVYQGFSVSFDMWCEESWITYFAGASLIIADAATAKSIDELPDFFNKHRISVLHAVPSLLAVIDDEIPTIRMVNAGGEACTRAVLKRWSVPGKRIFYNSYGPTETTVTSNMVALNPDDTIVIGHPLPNYNMAILDDSLNLLPYGEPGELVISGPGVGNGYIELPELSASKFITNPIQEQGLPGLTIYRTGDSAIIHSNGNIEFLGRFDDQVKIRGYRIELGEIESQLSQVAGVATAAVAIKKDNLDQDQIVGYVLPKAGSIMNEQVLRQALALVLPNYMVPGVILILSEIPRLSSGKVDRKKLPLPTSFEKSSETVAEPEKINPDLPVTEKVFAMLHQIFPGKKIEMGLDFFTDLGGHSLVAAVFVSRLRKEAGMTDVSLKDVYLNRPIGVLIDKWKLETEQADKSFNEDFHPVSRLNYWLCAIAQTFAVLFILGLFGGEVFFPYLGYYYVQFETESHFWALIVSFFIFLLIPPFFVFTGVFVKRIVLGKVKEGDYPLWGSYYFRHWFVKSVQSLVPVQFLNGTPLYNIYLRWMGVKIGENVHISPITIGAEDLITIGDHVTISSHVVLNNAYIEKGMLRIRKIELKDFAYIGTNSVVGGGCTVGKYSELRDLSNLTENTVTGEREIWQGSPSEKLNLYNENEMAEPQLVPKEVIRNYSLLYSVLLIAFPLVVLVPFFPVIYSINELDNAANDYDFRYMVYVPLLTLGYQLIFMLVTIVFTRWLMHGIKPGRYPVYSKVYVRKWITDLFMSLSLIVMHPLYATVYISAYFSLLGSKIGKKSEISTASSVTHTMLTIGDGCFIADAVTLGEADVRNQELILQETSIGNRSFVGNSASIPQGYHLPRGVLIGVLSTPPGQDLMDPNKPVDWFGSPAIAMPKRQDSGSFGDNLTMNPSRIRFYFRAFVELIRIILPQSVILCLSILFIAYVDDLLDDYPLYIFILLFPVYILFFISLPAFLITVFLKWILVGKYKESQHPMWTLRVWLSEAVTVIYEALAVPFFLTHLRGTAWLPFFLRFLGVNIGKRVCLETTDITEFDMVSIGDDTVLNEDCGPQTHLFEDRVMKIGKVHFGERCTVGARTIVLYNTEIGNDVSIDSLSLVMKGENLLQKTMWTGSPVRKSKHNRKNI